jgi:hypothetical protein
MRIDGVILLRYKRVVSTYIFIERGLDMSKKKSSKKGSKKNSNKKAVVKKQIEEKQLKEKKTERG